ncbi:metallopeptidase family M24 [Diplocarpon rosae]|nr:metallopeptidase family M24 [Diplocarpon rosae]
MEMTSERPASRDSSWSLDVEEFEDVVSISKRRAEIYPAKKHARSVAKHLSVKSGLVFLPGSPSEEYEDSDEAVHFRQRRYFYYLSGLTIPDSIVTFDIGRNDLRAWIPPTSSGFRVIYNGSSPSREEVQENHDFDHVDYINKLDEYVKNFIRSDVEPTVFLLHKYQEAFASHIFRPPPAENKKKVRFDSNTLLPAMNAARVIKSSYEIKMIRKACEITAKAHVNVLKHVKAFSNESEIEAIFTATCIAHQAKQQAYGIIAGSGPNASTLHYSENNESLKGRQLVCLDAGCEWNCYASDVTRTFPISGEYTPEAKAIYELVANMQEECIAMVKPGADYREINLKAHEIATHGLIQLGLLHNGLSEDILASGASRAFFPHGLGRTYSPPLAHECTLTWTDYMGLETHDVGDGGALLLRNHRGKTRAYGNLILPLGDSPSYTAASVLAENMVITVEPGIYFNRYAMEEVWLKDHRISRYIHRDLLEKYYPVGGVRIEDDILVTIDGHENITQDIPKGDAALRIINEGLNETVIVEQVHAQEDPPRQGWFW